MPRAGPENQARVRNEPLQVDWLVVWRSAVTVLALSLLPACVDASPHPAPHAHWHQSLVAKGAKSVSVAVGSFCCNTQTAHTFGPVQVRSPGKVQKLIAILDSLGPAGRDECDLCNVWELTFHYKYRPTEKIEIASASVSRLKPHSNLRKLAGQSLFTYLFGLMRARHLCRRHGQRLC